MCVFVYESLSSQCLTRYCLLFACRRIHLRRLLGALRILAKPGNAGTRMYQRGAEEHGCDFAPFAIYKIAFSKFLEPLAAGAVFATGVQKAYPVKAAVRHPHIRHTRILRITIHSVSIIKYSCLRIDCHLFYHFSISQLPILHKLPGDDIFIPPPGTYIVIIKLSGKFCKNHSRSFIFLNPSVMS